MLTVITMQVSNQCMALVNDPTYNSTTFRFCKIHPFSFSRRRKSRPAMVSSAIMCVSLTFRIRRLWAIFCRLSSQATGAHHAKSREKFRSVAVTCWHMIACELGPKWLRTGATNQSRSGAACCFWLGHIETRSPHHMHRGRGRKTGP